MEFPLSLFAPDSLVSRVRFDRPVPRQPAHYATPRLNLELTYGTPLLLPATVSIRTVMRHRDSPEFLRSRNCVTYGVHYREPAHQGQ